MSADIAGTAALLLGRSDAPTDPLPDLCAGPDVDLVVSANLLSQLPILPLDRLEARGGEAPPGLGRASWPLHLAALEARICLVTDVTEIERDRAGITVESLTRCTASSSRTRTRRGTGRAPFGEAAREREIIHRVHAYRDWGGTCRAARWSAT